MRSRFRVLVVEDEQGIRDAVCSTLQDFGFEPVEAASGTAALALIHGTRAFDALFTDIRLGPGPDGWEVALAFREANPDKPVIYASAFAPGERRRVRDSLFFPKPYRAAKVAAALQVLVFPSSDPELLRERPSAPRGSIVRLTYMSRPTAKALQPGFDVTLAGLRQQARRLNAHHGLTGALIASPEFFIQVIEGESQPLFATLARITRDLRHDEVRIFDISADSARMFGDWAMHVATDESMDTELIWACEEAFRHPGPLGAKVLLDALLKSVRMAA